MQVPFDEPGYDIASTCIDEPGALPDRVRDVPHGRDPLALDSDISRIELGRQHVDELPATNDDVGREAAHRNIDQRAS
jgi:hypothetical protein